MTADSRTKEVIKVDTTVIPPRNFNVIYVNDEVTTKEFVVETLVLIFNHDEKRADELTMQVHVEGSAIVATLPYELAEQKGVEVTMLARNNGFPLNVKLELDSE